MVPDAADHSDTFTLRVRVKALWPPKMFGDRDRQRHVISSQKTALLCAVTPHCAVSVWYEERMWTVQRQITSALILSISCQRCAFSFRFGIKLWSWRVDCHVMMNRDSPLHQAFSVSVLLCSVSHTAPKNVCYISCSHCRNACCWLGGWWLWQFTVALWCPVHLHQNCTVIRWWGQGSSVSQGTCQTTHAATETLP